MGVRVILDVYEYCTTTIHYNEIDFTNFFFIVTVLFVSPIYNQRVAQIARVELDELVAMYRTVDNIPEDGLLDAIEKRNRGQVSFVKFIIKLAQSCNLISTKLT